jgi:sulfatase modifying factor 1
MEQDLKPRRKYRLPTEAEWEYAARAMSTTPFHFGTSLDSTQANFDGNFPYGKGADGPYIQRTCPVGRYPPNAFGLYDMHGNIHEWCSDWFDRDYYRTSPRTDPTGPARGTQRVQRGGCWRCTSRMCRAANRDFDRPAVRDLNVGFRVVLTLARK